MTEDRKTRIQTTWDRFRGGFAGEYVRLYDDTLMVGPPGPWNADVPVDAKTAIDIFTYERKRWVTPERTYRWIECEGVVVAGQKP